MAFDMIRRVGFPEAFLGLEPMLFRSPSDSIPDTFTARGRWKAGPLHTFCDDYRQEFFQTEKQRRGLK